MKNKFNYNDAMILDKIQEVLQVNNLDDMDLTEEILESIKSQLAESLTPEDINESAYILAQNFEELKPSSEEDIKEYISRLKNHLEDSPVKCIKAEFKGIEFDVLKDASVDEVFKDFYSKYDEIYGISEMLSDLGLK